MRDESGPGRESSLRRLNQPRTARVRTDARGVPRVVVLRRRTWRVRAVRDCWRVDDAWWRDPVSRLYYELELADARVVTLYHDLLTGQWFQQWYG